MTEELKKAVTQRLYEAFDSACEIYTQEAEQEVCPPFLFVELSPLVFTLENTAMERQSVQVRMVYIPEKYNQDIFSDAAGRIKNAFLYTPLPVCGRCLQTNQLRCEITDGGMVCTMTYEYFVDPGILDESGFEEMQGMELNLYEE